MRAARSEENIAAVEASVENEQNLTCLTTWKILRNDFGLETNNIQFKANDHRLSHSFAE